MTKKLKALDGHKRISTQELLQQIYAAMADGETDFDIEASGQHDIGGPLWSADGKQLTFKVKNPGQRIGSMCLPNTKIIVEGSAPADVGWLNAGGEITVLGDGGDTTAHCAAAGKIYVGGRAGTRSGSLMKHDPSFEPPEFWVLKNTGSFAFEFMGGGIGVICGYDSEEFESVLGDRGCTGMVGGVVYVRGHIKNIASDVRVFPLDQVDKDFIKAGMPNFLKEIGREKLEKELTNWADWHKVVPLTYEESHKKTPISIKNFRDEFWVEEGIFSDVFPDSGHIDGLVTNGINRLRYPKWENKKFSAPCEFNCPAGIPTQDRYNLLRNDKTQEALELIYKYSPFPKTVCGEVCPNLCMTDCTRKFVDQPIDIKGLGSECDMEVTNPKTTKKETIAIIGAGVGGLTTAWHLRMLGYPVTVFDKDGNIGGKLANAVSRERLMDGSLDSDLGKFEKIGIEYKLNTAIDAQKYVSLKADYDYVVLATGAYQPKVPPFIGKEKLVHSLAFLADVNAGKKPNVGEKVIVIGAGNTGMDVVFGAYACGAKEVTCIDVQKPAAFPQEITHAKHMGAKVRYPIYTKEILDDGIITSSGEKIDADTVIIAIGEVPILDHVQDPHETTRGYLNTGDNYHLADNVYAIGDVINLGLLVDAIGHGREVANVINAKANNEEYKPEVLELVSRNKIVTAYFDKQQPADVCGGCDDKSRCISCGTCRDCEICKDSCPELAITRVEAKDQSSPKGSATASAFEYVVDDSKCIGCGICVSICPCGVWNLYSNSPYHPGEEIEE